MNTFMKIDNTFGTMLNVFGIMFSVNDVNSILNLILLVVSIASIVARAVILVVQKRREKDYNGAVEELDKAKDEIESLRGGRKDE